MEAGSGMVGEGERTWRGSSCRSKTDKRSCCVRFDDHNGLAFRLNKTLQSFEDGNRVQYEGFKVICGRLLYDFVKRYEEMLRGRAGRKAQLNYPEVAAITLLKPLPPGFHSLTEEKKKNALSELWEAQAIENARKILGQRGGACQASVGDVNAQANNAEQMEVDMDSVADLSQVREGTINASPLLDRELSEAWKVGSSSTRKTRLEYIRGKDSQIQLVEPSMEAGYSQTSNGGEDEEHGVNLSDVNTMPDAEQDLAVDLLSTPSGLLELKDDGISEGLEAAPINTGRLKENLNEIHSQVSGHNEEYATTMPHGEGITPSQILSRDHSISAEQTGLEQTTRGFSDVELYRNKRNYQEVWLKSQASVEHGLSFSDVNSTPHDGQDFEWAPEQTTYGTSSVELWNEPEYVVWLKSQASVEHGLSFSDVNSTPHDGQDFEWAHEQTTYGTSSVELWNEPEYVVLLWPHS